MQQLLSLLELNVQPEDDKNCCLLPNPMQDLEPALPLQICSFTLSYLGKAFNWHCRKIFTMKHLIIALP